MSSLDWTNLLIACLLFHVNSPPIKATSNSSAWLVVSMNFADPQCEYTPTPGPLLSSGVLISLKSPSTIHGRRLVEVWMFPLNSHRVLLPSLRLLTYTAVKRNSSPPLLCILLFWYGWVVYLIGLAPLSIDPFSRGSIWSQSALDLAGHH